MTIIEAITEVNDSTQAYRRWIQRPKLPHTVIEGSVLYRDDALITLPVQDILADDWQVMS